MENELFESLREEFYLESRERIAQIEEALLSFEGGDDEARERALVDTKRELHTLKGNSGMMGLSELQGLAHGLEDLVQALMGGVGDVREILSGVDRFRRLLDKACRLGGDEQKTGEDASQEPGSAAVQESVRISFSALDGLVDMLSEMVIFRNRLSESLDQGLARLDKAERGAEAWKDIEVAHEALTRSLDRLRQGVMRLRMVPLGTLFTQLKRVAFDESQAAGKQVELETSGGDTPLDRALLEVASEAMGHLVRNAIVHGIESPSERAGAAKPLTGRLRILAEAMSEEVIIDIEDDGRGVDRAALLEAARRKGHELPDEVDVQTLLFLAGVSTRQSADRSAGRGMGMSAVLEAVRRRGGQVEVVSAVGVGTRFRLRLPLTASIMRALMLAVCGEEYALPMASVQETLSLSRDTLHQVNGAPVMKWRGGLVPLLDLGVLFDASSTARAEGFVIVIEAEGKLRGLIVDDIVGVRDVVMKPLDEIHGAPRGLAGCTILGDGRVILILDPPELTSFAGFSEVR